MKTCEDEMMSETINGRVKSWIAERLAICPAEEATPYTKVLESLRVSLGEVDKGIAMIEQGIAKGGLKRTDDAKLRLGMALLAKNKAKAQQALRSVGGSDGAADIARLWVVAGA
jgi:hypothetical protein